MRFGTSVKVVRNMETDSYWNRFFGVDRIVALCRDPETLFVYFELRRATRDRIGQHFGRAFDELPLALRIYDVTGVAFDGGNAHAVGSIDLGAHEDHRYIGDCRAGGSYVVDYGLWTDAGQFFTVMRSVPVVTPRVRSDGQQGLVRFAKPGERSEQLSEVAMTMPDMPHFANIGAYAESRVRS
jgi:hypothetical protein